jgi:hypothetical protein
MVTLEAYTEKAFLLTSRSLEHPLSFDCLLSDRITWQSLHHVPQRYL